MSRMCENGETKRTAHVISEKLRTCDVSLDKNVNFSNLLLSDAVLQGLVKSGFHTPSPIQLKAIPLGRCGLDLIVQAKSGTGKTCVFTVIALEGIVVESKSLQVLVLAPTREIAVQIHDVIQSIGQCLPGLRCHTFIGGLPVSEDRQKLKKCHIAVGSPGRIKQLIEENALSTENVRLFILDEADKLLEEGFQEQINWIYSSLPENKQMVALSATYPEYLAHHLKVYMRNPTFVRLNSVDPALLGVKQFYQVVRFHPLPHVAFENKVQHLTHLLSTVAFHQCLIFSNYQSRAESLSNILNSRGLPSTCIAGSLDQKQRMEAMSKLRNFECRVLISTDLTSRGIDVDKINLVINLDLPKDHETYLHRIGRAGRFGSYGVAVTYVCRGNEELALRTMEKACNTHIDTLPDPVPSDLAKNESYLNLNELVTTEQIDTSLTMGKTSILDRFTAGNKEGDTSKTCPSSFDSCSLGEARNEAVNGYLQSAVPPDGLIGPELGVDKSVFFENCLDSYLGSETSSQEMPSGCKNLNPATGISAAYSCTAPAEADDKLRRLSVDNIEELDRSSIRGGCENSSVDGERDLRKPGVISAEEATSCTNNQDSIFSFVGNGKERVRIPKLTFSKTKVKNIETSYDGIMQDYLTFCRSGESHSAIDKAGGGVSYGDQSADGDTKVAGMDRGQLKCYEVGLIEQVSGLLESVYIDYLTVSRFCHMTGQSSVACRPFHFLHQRESLRECDVGQPKPLFEKSTQTEAVGDLGLQTMDSCGKSANFDLSSGRHYDSGLLMTTELSNPGNDSSSEDLESDSCSDLTECSDKDSDEWSETELSGLAGTHAGYCPECDPQDCQTYENNPDDSYCLPSQSCCCHGNGCVNNDMGHGNQPYEDHGVWGIYPYSSTMYSALCQSYYTQAMSWQGWKSHKS